MTLTPTNQSDKSWNWVAMDFADEELKRERFAIKFKTAEVAKDFEIAFYSFAAPATPPPEPVPEPVAEPAPPQEAPKMPSFGFGSAPPENESPAEMAQRWEREKLAKELASAAAKNQFTFGVKAAAGGPTAPSETKSTPIFGATAPGAAANTGFGGSSGFGGGASTGFGTGSSGFSFGTGNGTSSSSGGFSFGVTTNGAAPPPSGTNYKSLGFGVVEDDESDAGSDELYGSNRQSFKTRENIEKMIILTFS